MNGKTTPEETKHLAEMIQNYLVDDSKANGDAVLNELRFGKAQLYVVLDRATSNIVPLRYEGTPINVFQAAISADTAEAEINYRDSPNELRLFPSYALARFMELMRNMMMILNRGRHDEVGIVYDEEGWRIGSIKNKPEEPARKASVSHFTRADRKKRRN